MPEMSHKRGKYASLTTPRKFTPNVSLRKQNLLCRQWKQCLRSSIGTCAPSSHWPINPWHWAVTGWDFSSTHKATEIEMAKSPYRLGSLMTNSPESWHGSTERVPLVTVSELQSIWLTARWNSVSAPFRG